jgi:biotin synthase-like enzyme
VAVADAGRVGDEGVADVAAAFGGVEFGLRGGGAAAHEGGVVDAQGERGRQAFREFQRLVVAAFAQAPWVQRYRNDQGRKVTLLSIKTGACPEDCAYCPQSGALPHRPRGREADGKLERVVAKAQAGQGAGASRFCMGAAWRSPKERDMPKVAAMVREVKALGLETCATLGMLSRDQAQR